MYSLAFRLLLQLRHHLRFSNRWHNHFFLPRVSLRVTVFVFKSAHFVLLRREAELTSCRHQWLVSIRRRNYATSDNGAPIVEYITHTWTNQNGRIFHWNKNFTLSVEFGKKKRTNFHMCWKKKIFYFPHRWFCQELSCMFTDRYDSVFNITIFSFVWVSLKSYCLFFEAESGDYVTKLNAPTSPLRRLVKKSLNILFYTIRRPRHRSGG
jgi:hypothetical protein